MELNNAAEIITDLKLRQSDISKDNQSNSDSDSEHSVSDIIDNDICLASITNDEIASVSDQRDSNYILIPPNPPSLVDRGLLVNGGFQGGLDQREDPYNDSEQSDADIIDNDICLDPITNDEIASASQIIPNQSKSDIV